MNAQQHRPSDRSAEANHDDLMQLTNGQGSQHVCVTTPRDWVAVSVTPPPRSGSCTTTPRPLQAFAQRTKQQWHWRCRATAGRLWRSTRPSAASRSRTPTKAADTARGSVSRVRHRDVARQHPNPVVADRVDRPTQTHRPHSQVGQCGVGQHRLGGGGAAGQHPDAMLTGPANASSHSVVLPIPGSPSMTTAHGQLGTESRNSTRVRSSACRLTICSASVDMWSCPSADLADADTIGSGAPHAADPRSNTICLACVVCEQATSVLPLPESGISFARTW